MRQTILYLFLILTSVVFANDTEQQNIISQANEAYKNKKFDKAIELYESIVNQNIESPELYFNLGNSYYKLSKIAPAILNYERAKLLSPNDEDINFNLSIAQKNTIDKNEIVPELAIFTWIKALINIFNADTWAIISVFSFLLFLSFLAVFLLSNKIRLKKIGLLIAVIFFVGTIKTLIFSYQQKEMQFHHQKAIIFTPSVEIKSSPDKNGTIEFVLHEGTKVLVLEEVADWLEIKISDGRVGWLPSKSIKMI